MQNPKALACSAGEEAARGCTCHSVSIAMLPSEEDAEGEGSTVRGFGGMLRISVAQPTGLLG